MKYVTDTRLIFRRYDTHIEASRQAARRVSDDQLLQQVADCLVDGDEDRMKKTDNPTGSGSHASIHATANRLYGLSVLGGYDVWYGLETGRDQKPTDDWWRAGVT